MIKKLIVIDGLDGSGKATQAKLLQSAMINQLKNIGKDSNVIKLSFPVYDSPSSSLVKMYLNGQLSDSPDGVNAYIASAFYAVDRCAHFLEHNLEYDQKWCIADRYTTSNIIYQTSKLPKEKWTDFINWCIDFEYNKLGIPKPDLVIYLDMPTKISQNLMSKRYNGQEEKKDLHESNIDYLNKCREAALYIANILDWKVVKCNINDEPKSIDTIQNEIKNIINSWYINSNN